MTGKKLLMMGPPASGKGTVGELLSQALKLPLVSVGQVLRNLTPESPLYPEIHAAMNSGGLAPNQHVAQVLRDVLGKSDYAKGYILDGWARQISDLQYFDPGFDKVIFLNISPETTIKRISGRRICDVDQKIYNIYSMTAEELKACPGNLTQREDDKEAVVKNRLEVYKKLTLPVVTYFEQKGTLLKVNAESDPQRVLTEILSKL